jgi:hypothetical protein
MLEWFQIGFGLGLGLLAALLALALTVGVVDSISDRIQFARWRRKLQTEERREKILERLQE